MIWINCVLFSRKNGNNTRLLLLTLEWVNAPVIYIDICIFNRRTNKMWKKSFAINNTKKVWKCVFGIFDNRHTHTRAYIISFSLNVFYSLNWFFSHSTFLLLSSSFTSSLCHFSFHLVAFLSIFAAVNSRFTSDLCDFCLHFRILCSLSYFPSLSRPPSLLSFSVYLSIFFFFVHNFLFLI